MWPTASAMDSIRNKTVSVRVRGEKSLDQEKYKKRNKLLAEFLKSGAIKQGKTMGEII